MTVTGSTARDRLGIRRGTTSPHTYHRGKRARQFFDEAANLTGLLTERERGALRALVQLLNPPKVEREWYRHPGRRGYARPEQIPPEWEWLIWLILAGRGAGKTRTGAEWAAEQMLTYPNSFGIVGAPTFADGRDTCMEGESGLIAVLGGEDGPHIRNWNRSEGLLVLKNGSKAKIFSGEEPNRFRGPNARWAWLDEFAVWKRLEEAWKMLRFTMRAGGKSARPQTVITTTPKMLPLLKTLLKKQLAQVTDTTGVQDRKLPPCKPNGTLHLTLGKTFDNAENLAETYIEEMTNDFEGTRLGRQELYAEILEEIEGALWTEALIQRGRAELPTKSHFDRKLNQSVEVMALTHIVVAVDPAVSTGRNADTVGIVVVGLGEDGECYVLDDTSIQGKSPEVWADAVLDAYELWQADEIIGEVNNGGDLVRTTIWTQAKERSAMRPRFRKVNATRGKALRAEPVVQLYELENPRIHHVKVMAKLEDELTTWVPRESKWSPGRLDALVWGVTAVMGLTAKGKRRRSSFRRVEDESLGAAA